MATESPYHPQPDEIPDNERTGDEPNPSGRASKPKEKSSTRPSAKNLLVEFRHHSDERPIALHERGHEALICSAVMCGGNTPRGPKEFSNGSPLGPSLEGATLNEPAQGDGH